MAVQADVAQGGRGYRALTATERNRAFRNARIHSFFVRALRRLLPVIALLVLAAYFITAKFSVEVGELTASIDGLQVVDGNLRMLNPTLKGADKEKGKYVVRADYADQDIEAPNVVKLTEIDASIDDPSGGWQKMTAARGVFDTKSERLVLKDKVTIATSSGLTGELKYATVEMDTNTLRSHNPVVFEFTGGSVRANAMTLLSKEDTVVFRGNVAVRIERDKLAEANAKEAQTKPPQASPPAPAADGQSLPPGTPAMVPTQ